MNQLTIFVLLFLTCIMLAACDSVAAGPSTEDVNAEATVIAPASVYDTIELSTKVGTLDVGDTVFVKERTTCPTNACKVEAGEVAGWIRCTQLDLDA
jgi:hypothetical protein